MATTTPNYGLRKPTNADTVNVATDISANMDLLDAHAHSGTYVALVAAPTGVAATDTSVVQAAIDAANAAGGGRIILAAGTYVCTSLTLYSKVRIVGAGSLSTTLQMSSPTTGNFIAATGTLATIAAPTATVTVNVAAQATAITVDSTSGLAVGDWFVLGDSVVTDAAYATRYNGELLRVYALTATTITTLTPIANAYTTAQTAKIQKLTPLTGIGLEGLRIVNPSPGTNTKTGAWFFGCTGLSVVGCRFEGIDNPALELNFCGDTVVDRCTFIDLTDDEANSRFGYGVNIGGACTAVTVSDCRFIRIRHAVTTNGYDTLRGEPTDILIDGCTAIGATTAAFDTHQAGIGITFTGCVARGSNVATAVGYQARAKRVSILGCRAFDLASSAVYSTGTPSYLHVSGCSFSQIAGSGIRLDGALTGLVLADNIVTDCTQSGILLIGTGDSVVIAGNTVRNVATSGNYSGIAVTNGSTHRIERNSIMTSYYGVRLESGVSFAFVYGNFAGNLGSGSNPITDAGTSNRVHGNQLVENQDTARTTLAANGAVTFALAAGHNQIVTLQANATSSTLTQALDGEMYTIEWLQDGTGGRTYVWPTSVRWANGEAPPPNLAANARDSVTFRYDASTGLFYEYARAIDPALVRGQAIGTAKLRTTKFYAPQGAGATVALANNNMRATPFWVPNNATITTLGLEVTGAGAASSTVRLGIYNDDGSGWPGTLLVDAGTIAGDSATYQSKTVSQAVTPGLYWLAACCSTGGTNPTIRANTASFQAVAATTASTLSANNAGAAQQTSGITAGAFPTPWGGSVGDFTTTGPRIIVGVT